LQSTSLDLISQINQVITYQIQEKNQRVVLFFYKINIVTNHIF
jgi:hypothetical protein